MRVGDLLATVRGSGRVIRIERERRQGVFNPFTVSGSLVVNGVHTFCASDSFLDRIVPDRMLPVAWGVLLSPLHWLQRIAPEKMQRFHEANRGMEMSARVGTCLSTFASS